MNIYEFYNQRKATNAVWGKEEVIFKSTEYQAVCG